MKNYDGWKKFIRTGKIDDYLNYIACAKEEGLEDMTHIADKSKEGEMRAGINYSDGDGSISHAGW